MAVQTQRMTVEEFERFAALPANANRLFEYIGGEVVEVVTNSYSSLVAAQILIAVGAYIRQHGLGYITGADGGYAVAGERYLPDVGFVTKKKQPIPPHETYIAHAPDLAVEVISPTDKPSDVRVKVINYLAAGTVVWVVDPERKVVEVCNPGQRVRPVGSDGVLDGGDILPGFALAVKEIFPE